MVSNKHKEAVCPLCHGHDTTSLFRKEGMPLYTLERHYALGSALKASTGVIHFHLCRSCSFVFNSEFEPSRMKYDINYENSRAHSQVYDAYLSGIVAQLDRNFKLSNKVLVDVGCGSGEFLKKIVTMFPTVKGYGFDPSLNTEICDQPGIVFVKDYFNPASSNLKPDIIVLTHVVEHIKDIHSFLESIIPKKDDEDKKPGKELGVYIETPSWEWIADNNSFFAFAYEHCSYYSSASIRTALSQHGFLAREIGFSFQDEYLQYFGLTPGGRNEQVNRQLARKVVKKTEDFKARLPMIMGSVKEMICSLPKGAVLWGAAGKGTTLLNLFDLGRESIAYVVDSNPQRWNSYIPRTGQKIVKPELLKELRPEHVIITNQIYYNEIKSKIKQMGLKTKIIAIDRLLTGNKVFRPKSHSGKTAEKKKRKKEN